MLNTKHTQKLKLSANQVGQSPIEWMLHRGEAEGDRVAFSCGKIDSLKGPQQQMTFADLSSRAKALAVKLWDSGIKSGDRVAILLPNGLDYIVSVYGIMAAGAIAVPLFPPGSSGHGDRLESVILEVKPSMVFVTEDTVEKAKKFLIDLNLSNCKVASPTLNDLSLAANWNADAVMDARDIAFLQYTSGSTSTPKGVMVTKSGLLANSYAIGSVFNHVPTTSTTGVSWLPLFHDMGMVGSVFHAVHMGCPVHLMQPLDFLKRPASWLRAVSMLGAVTSGGPNFGYELCVDQIRDDQMEGVDLSSWKVAYNGSEPISASTINRFVERFSPWNFKRSSMLPCYGLAEYTLLVSGSKVTDDGMVHRFDTDALAMGQARPVVDSGRMLVASGSWVESTDVIIIDPASDKKLNDGEIGNIVVNGPDIAQGYWKNVAATAAAFGSDDNDNSPRFLRTGDNGFILDNRLFVTGRSKEMIVIRGRNLYPHDLEEIALSAFGATKRLGAAAFSVVGESGETMVLVCEASNKVNEPEKLARSVRLAIAVATGIQPSAVVLVRKNSLPKTSSGKLRRVEIAEQYQRDELAEFFRDEHEESTETRPRPNIGTPYREPETKTERTVAEVWSSVLRIENIGADDNFLALGGDSICAVQIANKVGTSLGIVVELRDVFEANTIAEVAALIDRQLKNADEDDLVEIEL